MMPPRGPHARQHGAAEQKRRGQVDPRDPFRRLIHKPNRAGYRNDAEAIHGLISILKGGRVALEVQQLFPSCSVFSGIEQGSAKSCCSTRL